MKIAVCSDEPYAIHDLLVASLKARGHGVVPFGSIRSGEETSWVHGALEAAEAIRSGACDEGVLCCWTGTGIAMAANKVQGIRAALCVDAATARGARVWNHANVLALSNRLLGEHILEEILDAWFAPFSKPASGVQELKAIDQG